MHLINHAYDSENKLSAFLQQHCFATCKTVLIQVFCGTGDMSILQPVLDAVARHLPHAHVIGASTAGEILDGQMSQQRIVLSCACFQHTVVETLYTAEATVASGQFIAQQLVSPDTKALICFTEGLNSDPEGFLQGLAANCASAVVAGGNAADNNRFEKTFIIKGTRIYETGAVAAGLSGKNLIAGNAFSLNWLPLGPEFVVTKSVKNRVYEMDHTPVREICRSYLGEDAIRNLPAGIIEFPLIKTADQVPIARSIVAIHEDGAFQYAGHLNEGDRVRFGVGNLDAFLEGALTLRNDVLAFPVEALFIYSCSVRKLFLKSDLETEMRALSEIGPTSGFFTYGEFYQTRQNRSNQLFNISTTVLVLSEDPHAFPGRPDPIPFRSSTIKTLTHLVNKTQKALEKNNAFLQQYKKVVDISSIVFKTDLQGNFIYVNDNFTKISQFSREELIGNSLGFIRHPDTPKTIFKELWQTIRSGNVWQGVIKNKKKDGAHYYVYTTITPLFNEKAEIIEYICVANDITTLVLQDKKLRQQSTDELTGLPNRIKLLEDIKDIRSKEDIGIIMLDVDRFAIVNGLYGYTTGDALLLQIARRLEKKIRFEQLKLYKISADIFVILYQQVDLSDIRMMIEELDQFLNHGYLIDGQEIHLSFTASLCCSPHDPLRKAELALRKAKEKKIRFLEYTDTLDEKKFQSENVYWLQQIRETISTDSFVPFFQPIQNLHTGKIEKYESLARMVRRDGTVVSPFMFLNIAKNAKLYPFLTRTMVTKTLKAVSETSRKMAINLSVEDVLDTHTIDFLIESIIQYQAGESITVEITESEGFENFQEILTLAAKIRDLGGKIAIDDFGTGYSNFAYLLKLKPDYIKIDGSIIKNIDTDPSAQTVAEAIVSFSQKLNIQTIAEFVHSEEVRNKTKAIGIDMAQGFYIGKPHPHVDQAVFTKMEETVG